MSYSNTLGPSFNKVSEHQWLEEIAESCRTYKQYKTFCNLLELWVSKYSYDKYEIMWPEWKAEKLSTLAFMSRDDIPESLKLKNRK